MKELKGNFSIKQRPFYMTSSDFASPRFYHIMSGQLKPTKDAVG